LIDQLDPLRAAVAELNTAPATIVRIRDLVRLMDGYVKMIERTVKMDLYRALLEERKALQTGDSNLASAAAAAAPQGGRGPRITFSGRASVAAGGVVKQTGLHVKAGPDHDLQDLTAFLATLRDGALSCCCVVYLIFCLLPQHANTQNLQPSIRH
jgi:hypothetical protein